MSVTIQIMGTRATLANGKWRSGNAEMRALLNSHLATVQLEIPAHWPPSSRELAAARAAAKVFAGEIVGTHEITDGPSRNTDGSQVVF